jgi:putative membrane protein
MKIHKSIVLQITLLIAVIIGTASCMSTTPKDPKEVADTSNDSKFKGNKENDAEFLVNAAEISRNEIRLGQLAQQKGNISAVKELGKMMEYDHTKSLADLTALAETKKMALPVAQTDQGEEEYDRLNAKSGDEFNEEYCKMMVSGHKHAIDVFEKAAMDCTDAAIKAWAASTLPTLRNHLDHALTCQRECEKS